MTHPHAAPVQQHRRGAASRARGALAGVPVLTGCGGGEPRPAVPAAPGQFRATLAALADRIEQLRFADEGYERGLEEIDRLYAAACP